jgi:transcription elongation factor SPT6
MPERMQLRNVPITSVEEGSAELDLEAEWIYKHAFSKASISNQVKTTLILLHARQFLKSLLKP